MSSSRQEQLRSLPSVEAVLQQVADLPWAVGIPHCLLSEAVREAIHRERDRLTAQDDNLSQDRATLTQAIVAWVESMVKGKAGPHYRRAINATGIILHTGLGRAVLPASAVARVQEELAGYSVLQVDTETGKRSRRDARIEWLLQKLTGAQAATVVNNNAAATILVLNTLARGREVIVSRGQLVEIGGSFRLPDVMALSGARLVEVGTTNKTHPRDYEQAITENTAAILRVHPSNYRIEGFTAETPLDALVEIAHNRGLPVIDDVGAGALIDYARLGLPHEPTLPESVRAGADLVLSSADKMIGGPQGGLILGRADLIGPIRKNPLARALRVDKVTLSLLESTLMLFLDEQRALNEVPTLRMMQRPLEELRQAAEHVAGAICDLGGGHPARLSEPDAQARVLPTPIVATIDGFSQMGSGSLPGHDLPTVLVAIDPVDGDAEALAVRLRRHSPPVFARIAQDRVLLDPRTILSGEEATLIDAVIACLLSAPSA